MAKKKEKTQGKEKSKAKAKKKKLNIKEFFVLNCEKMLLIVIIPIALYVAYCGTLYKPLRWQPDELQRISQEADQHVKTNVRKASDENVTITPYDTHAQWIKKEISLELYRTEVQWLPPLFPEKNKRPGLGPNQLFSVRNLKAVAGLGALAITPLNIGGSGAPRPNPVGRDGAGMGVERVGKRWVVVTGLIPIKDQLNVYIDSYSRSIQPDPMRDTPLYWLYDVERAEIEPGMTDDSLQWQNIDFIPTFGRDSLEWGNNFSMDPIDPSYLAALGAFPMAYPLPPVERPFGEEVVHAPAIPMLMETQVQAMKDAEKYQEQIDKLRLDIQKKDFLDQKPFGGSMSMGGDRMGGGGRMGTGDGGGGGAGSARQLREVAKITEMVKTVEVANYLYRFFDFTVQPGKTYRYRVRLYLANPNYQLPPNVLENDSLNKAEYFITDFSEPSNRVTVPLEARILVTNVSAPAPRTPWTEPDASVMAVHFDVKDGSEWCVELDRIYRGSTINIANKEGKNYRQDPSALNQGMMGGMSGPRPGTRPGTGPSRQPTSGTGRPNLVDTSKKTINVRSDVCVVDIFGGTALRKTGDAPDMKSPGKMLVLEPSGNLVIREVSTDLIEVELLKNPVSVNTTGGMGMGDM